MKGNAVKKRTTYLTTETFDDGDDRVIKITVGKQVVSVPVGPDVFAYYNSQFKKTTDLQQRRHATMQNLLRAAYKKGLLDGRSQIGAR